jgi:O-antigen/teichoic acid export membrane protein
MTAAATNEPITGARRDVLRSLSSLVIKVGAAGLTYLSYVVLSRLMGDEPYGQFALGLSLVTILAIIAGVGQQTAILRFWPEENGAGRPAQAITALRAGGTITVGAGFVLTIAVIVVAGIAGLALGFGQVSYLIAAALLTIPLAFADYFSAALRAQGSVWVALAPKDLIWRAGICVAAFVLVAMGVQLGGTSVLLMALAILVAALAGQWLFGRKRYRLEFGRADVAGYWAERGAASRWFLLGALLESISVNLDTVIVGLMVDPAAAGLYFNAFRTAGLLTLFLFANSLVIAPQLSRDFHGGNLPKVQRLLNGSAWGGFGFSLMIYVVFLFFGRDVLSLFGAGYEAGYPILLILGIGLLFDAATGPARTTLMMTGHERSFVLLFGAATVTGVIVTIIVVPFFGLIGAATVNTIARSISRVAISIWCVRRTGVDPTILGILRVNRDAAGVRP